MNPINFLNVEWWVFYRLPISVPRFLSGKGFLFQCEQDEKGSMKGGIHEKGYFHNCRSFYTVVSNRNFQNPPDHGYPPLWKPFCPGGFRFPVPFLTHPAKRSKSSQSGRWCPHEMEAASWFKIALTHDQNNDLGPKFCSLLRLLLLLQVLIASAFPLLFVSVVDAVCIVVLFQHFQQSKFGEGANMW